jgi:hypothetical protein
MPKHDYTRLPIGTKVDQGTIEQCPYCGKAGIHERVSGKDFYTHSQWVGFDEKGNPSIGWDMCPKL